MARIVCDSRPCIENGITTHGHPRVLLGALAYPQRHLGGRLAQAVRQAEPGGELIAFVIYLHEQQWLLEVVPANRRSRPE